MKEIKAIIQPFMLQRVCEALQRIEGLPGVTVSQVVGWGRAVAADTEDTVEESGYMFARKTKLEVVVPDALASEVMTVIGDAAKTGHAGDGKIFVHELVDVMKIRTGEHGEGVL